MMQEAFEAEFDRSWEDPASDEMKAVWAKSWAACQRTYFGDCLPIVFDPAATPGSFGRDAVEFAQIQMKKL